MQFFLGMGHPSVLGPPVLVKQQEHTPVVTPELPRSVQRALHNSKNRRAGVQMSKLPSSWVGRPEWNLRRRTFECGDVAQAGSVQG